jgi:hypothetical protein
MTQTEDIMRFLQITQAIECEFQNKRAFLCENLDEAVASCGRQAAQYGGTSRLALELTFKSEGNKKMIVAAALTTKYPQPAPLQQVLDFPRSTGATAAGDEE